MSKKIIILNGSPRINGNTSSLVNEFTRGAEEIGCEVKIFQLDKTNIHGCKGCFGGGKNIESPCVQKDNMDKIYPVYREADIVVLETPLYYCNFSGQLRTAFDRLFAVAECDPNYQNLMNHLEWTELSHVLAGGVMKVGDIKGNSKLQDAYELGKKVGNNSL